MLMFDWFCASLCLLFMTMLLLVCDVSSHPLRPCLRGVQDLQVKSHFIHACCCHVFQRTNKVT